MSVTVLLLAASPQGGVDQKQVDAAIRKGVQYLKKAPLPNWADGTFKNSEELVLWTFVHAGVPEHDPVFHKLFKRILETPLERTYSVALQAMILEELDRVKYQGRIASCAQFLADNQARNGQWGYGQNPVNTVASVPSQGRPGVATFGGVAGADKPRVVKTIKVHRTREAGDHGDNSNTQYAALGIRACHEAGIVFPKELIQRASDWWRKCQKEDEGGGARGWDYCEADVRVATGSMSAGGVGSLVIYDFIQEKDWRKDESVLAGIRWLAKHFSPEKNPNANGWFDYYYLYGVERAGTLFGSEKLGDHEWYAEGARKILAAQKADGSWGEEAECNRVVWDTCWAILFLRRATRPLVASEDGHRK